MDLRHILGALAVLVIAGLVIDGIRRARARRAPVAPEPVRRRADDDFNPELPSGGARVVARMRRDAVAAGDPAPEAPMPSLSARRAEQVDMFGDVEIPAAEPAPARDQRERGEVVVRGQRTPAATAAPSLPRQESRRPKRPAPEEVMVVHVMGGERRLDGKALMQAALDCGMRWGEYQIFHRYENGAADAVAAFSMANAVEPGVFDIQGMDQQTFVGVSFFLMLPGPANTRQALDLMIEAAQRVSRETGGELRDEHHSVLTPQTIEHLRQRVLAFERRRLAQQRVNG